MCSLPGPQFFTRKIMQRRFANCAENSVSVIPSGARAELGVTKSLQRGLWFHGIHRREALQNGTTLIDWYITKDSIILATPSRARKRSKGWRREKKNDLMRTLNPKWEDFGKEVI